MVVYLNLRSGYRNRRSKLTKRVFERAYEKLHEYYSKLDRAELLNSEEVYYLGRIERFAKRKGNEELKNKVDEIYSKLGEVSHEIAFREGENIEVNDGEFTKICEKDDVKIILRRIELR